MLLFNSPLYFGMQAMTDQETALSWLSAALKSGGATRDRLLADGEMLLLRSVPQGLLMKVELRIDPDMPQLASAAGPNAPVISVRCLSDDETQASFAAPLVCDGGIEHITTFPGHFFIARLGESNSYATSPFNSRRGLTAHDRAGWAMQAGIPNVITTTAGCGSANSVTQAWWMVSDTAYVPAPTLGAYVPLGGFPLAGTFRERWVIPPEGCYAYAWNDVFIKSAAGRYGTGGLDSYFTPRLYVPCCTSGYVFIGSRPPLPWRSSRTDDFIPDSCEPMIMFGGRQATVRGQVPNSVWRTVPNDQMRAINYQEAMCLVDWYNQAGALWDPLDRLLSAPPGTVGAPIPWWQYMDSSARGSLHFVHPGGGGAVVYVY